VGSSSPMKEEPNIEKYINQIKQKWEQGYEGSTEGNTWRYNIYYTKPLESDKKYELIWQNWDEESSEYYKEVKQSFRMTHPDMRMRWSKVTS